MNRKCQGCGVVYDMDGHRRQGKKYCSIECMRLAQRPKRRTCQQCGTEFAPRNPGRIGTGKFCNQACWRQWEQENRPKSFVFNCEGCGREFRQPGAWVRKQGKPKFCSRACAAAGRVRPESERSRGVGWRRIAIAIRERDGHRCVRCGGTALPGRSLHVDHVIPWVMVKEWPEIANHPRNLASLCEACHGVKTAKVEPRLMRGDVVTLLSFYGERITDDAYCTLGLMKAAQAS